MKLILTAALAALAIAVWELGPRKVVVASTSAAGNPQEFAEASVAVDRSSAAGRARPSRRETPDSARAAIGRWRDYNGESISQIRSQGLEENLLLDPEGYERLVALAESGDAGASYRLFLLHQNCKHNDIHSEADLASHLERLSNDAAFSDDSYAAQQEEQMLYDARRYEMCINVPRDHSLRAYRYLSDAAAQRYPPAILAFLNDARQLIQDEVFRQPDLVTAHLIALDSVVAEAELSGDWTVLLTLSREYSYSGTYGTNLEKRYLYTYLAGLAAADPRPFLSMVEAVEHKISPEKLREIREHAELLCEQSCRH